MVRLRSFPVAPGGKPSYGRSGIRLYVLLLFTTAMTITLTGCGSSSGLFGQAQKSYTLTVTGTATSVTHGTLEHSTTVTLVVEK